VRYVLPETPNGRGADALGMRPRDGGLDTKGMLEAARDGKLAVLAILGANPMLRHPDRTLVDAALRAAPFVVVTDLFLTETAELADLVIPVCSAFEKSGTTTDLAGDVLPVIGSVVPPEDVGADGDVFVALAEKLGVALPLPEAIETKIRELVRTPPPPPGDAAYVRPTRTARCASSPRPPSSPAAVRSRSMRASPSCAPPRARRSIPTPPARSASSTAISCPSRRRRCCASSWSSSIRAFRPAPSRSSTA